MLKRPLLTVLILLFFLFVNQSYGQSLQLNELEYFERPGLNVLVFSNQYNGMFFDEKTAGIEIIHHGVRTSTGGALRLQNTPEQWDLIPIMVERKVNKDKSIDVVLRYDDFDFNSRINVAVKGNGVEVNVYLDKPIPEKLAGRAGFNLEFLPSAYFEKTYLMDTNPGNFPRYPAANTRIEPISKKNTPVC